MHSPNSPCCNPDLPCAVINLLRRSEPTPSARFETVLTMRAMSDEHAAGS